MPKLSMTVGHTVDREEAGERLKSLLSWVKDRYKDQVGELQEEWGDHTLKFSFKTYGFKFQGQGVVEDTDVKLDVDIPFAAMMFKGKIESDLREMLTKALARERKTTGERGE
jgi:hypothetical protein